jgi:peptide/nickel transport system substrate-binding protein
MAWPGADGAGRNRGEPKKGGRLRIALRTNDISDPHTYSWGQPMYMRQVLETLTQTGVDNVTRPLLLESWEASDDLKTWTLKLREDVTWSDGRALRGRRRGLEPQARARPGQWFGDSVGLFAGFILEDYETGETDDDGNARTSRRLWREDAIEKIDDHTVVLHGHSPNVVIPELLYHYQITMLDPADDGVFTLDSATYRPLPHRRVPAGPALPDAGARGLLGRGPLYRGTGDHRPGR